MSEGIDNSKDQSTSKNSIIVGIVIGAGLGLVFGRVLFGDSSAGYVYGSMMGVALGLVFSLFFSSNSNKKSVDSDASEK
ncbi:MAG: hypothetical protein GKR89_36780 [Candidatus Latescibacteria bacterium]|nr:hypothetical protein [Candidatus Latescibacterota bacterium]